MSSSKSLQSIIIILVLGLIFMFYYFQTQISFNHQVINVLNDSLNECTDINQNIRTSYEELFYDINNVTSRIDDFQYEINQSMEWFNKNANIDEVSLKSDFFQCVGDWCYNALKYYLDDKCYQITPSGTCEVVLGCLELVNSKFVSLEYISDNDTSGKDDKLFGLSDFVSHGGGDCEDYSLFYKAELNYILDECGTVNFVAWKYTDDYNDYVSLEILPENYVGSYWISRYAEYYNIPINYKYPNVVCGNLYDFNEGTVSGHCMVAFTTKKVISIDDLDLLIGAYIVEPQTGMYMGRIRNKEHDDIEEELDYTPKIYLKDEYVTNADSFISQVITDNDLYQYTDEWISYESLSVALANGKNKLESIEKKI